MNQGNWFAVYTLPRWELKVVEQLKKKKIDCYCPQNGTDNKWAARRKSATQPLFSSYVFVYLTDYDRNEIKFVKGVVGFVYWLGKPAVINPDEIQTIKRFLYNYTNVRLEKISVSHTETARIINESFTNRKGNILEVKNTSVKAILPSLGQMLVSDTICDTTERINHPGMLKMTV